MPSSISQRGTAAPTVKTSTFQPTLTPSSASHRRRRRRRTDCCSSADVGVAARGFAGRRRVVGLGRGMRG